VDIDGVSQSEVTPGRLVDFQETPDATFATGDASYAWAWTWKNVDRSRGIYTVADVQAKKVVVPKDAEPELHTTNDFSFLKLPYAYLDVPKFESPSWILPAGALRPVVRQANVPVQRAFRSAGIVRGPHPYALVVDDIQKDDQPHQYDWTLTLERDIQIASVKHVNDHEMDILLTGSDPDQKTPPTGSSEPLPAALEPGSTIAAGQPMLLVRVLNFNPSKAAEPDIVELPNATSAKKYGPVRRLVIPAESVSPDFKVLLYPHRQGAPLPATAWNANRSAVTVTWPDQQDTLSFTPVSGRTNLDIARAGKSLLSLAGAIKPLPNRP
jgi:hypothetical protein